MTGPLEEIIVDDEIDPNPSFISATSCKPWIERYRPKSLKEVSHQSEVVATLQNATETGRLPHLLFYGPPGSGKTSVALALCRQLWHPSQLKRRVLELNASDERGISVVRDKIKHFASLSVGKGPVSNAKNFFQKNAIGSENSMDIDDNESDKYPNPPFKIIILDEADTVTPDAQAALRRIIEAHSRITRFILICNYVTRIIEPLASRCAKFRFQPLPPESMKERLTMIAENENFSQDEKELIDEILIQSDGDMRRAVTTLQSVHLLAVGGDVVTSDSIAEIAGLPPPGVVDTVWNSVTQSPSSVPALSTFDRMNRVIDDVCASGYSAQLLLSALLVRVMASPSSSDSGTAPLSDLSKSRIAIRIAEAEKNMIDGADEFLQLMTVCSLILFCFQSGI